MCVCVCVCVCVYTGHRRWCGKCAVRGVLQCVLVCCSVLQCVAVRCSLLQCVAVRCSVLRCVVVSVSEAHFSMVYHDVFLAMVHQRGEQTQFGFCLLALRLLRHNVRIASNSVYVYVYIIKYVYVCVCVMMIAFIVTLGEIM